MSTFSLIFSLLVVADCLLKFYLNHRQQVAIQDSFANVPAAFVGQISLIEHQKAAKYTTTKLKFATLELVYAASLTLIFTLGGGIDYLAERCIQLTSPLTSQVALIVSYTAIGAFLSLPLSLYHTFSIEQKFGFNKTTLRLYLTDSVKLIGVALLIGIPVLYLVFWLMQAWGSNWWLWVWLVLVVFNLLMLIIYPSFIAPLFNKFSPLTDSELKSKINRLLIESGFKTHGIYVMDGSKRSNHGNAYFTGLGTSKRIVFFDTLLKQLSHAEIIAILAHELGHFKHKHILKQMLLSCSLTLISLFIFSRLLNQSWFYTGLNVSHISHASGLLLLFIVFSLLNLPLSPLFSYLSRKNEFEADNFAKQHASSQDLISSLVKLYRDNASTLTPDQLYVKFYYSHPPATSRIANLEN